MCINKYLGGSKGQGISAFSEVLTEGQEPQSETHQIPFKFKETCGESSKTLEQVAQRELLQSSPLESSEPDWTWTLVGFAVLGLGLDLIVLKVFSNPSGPGVVLVEPAWGALFKQEFFDLLPSASL